MSNLLANRAHYEWVGTAAPYLAVLAKVLVEASGPPNKSLMLQLKDSYKKYAEEAQSSIAYLHLASGTFMFPIKVQFPGTSSESDLQIHVRTSQLRGLDCNKARF